MLSLPLGNIPSRPFSLIWVRTLPRRPGKVINLSDIQAADKGGKEASAPTPEKKAPEADKPPKRRGRPPKEQTGPTVEKKVESGGAPHRPARLRLTKAAREEAPPSVLDKVSRGKKADKGKETGSGGAPVSKSAKAVKPGKAAPVKEAAVPPPEINLPPTPDVPPRPVEEGKIVYLKMAELHPFHTFREHPYKVQDDKAMDDLVGDDQGTRHYDPRHRLARKRMARAMRSSRATAAIMVVHGPGWRKCPVSSGK